MANAGWGLDPWGLGFFGGLLGPLNLVSAQAYSTRVVRVIVSVPCLALTSSGNGDALNPATWMVARTDNGTVFTVASIDELNSTTFDITVVEAFGPASVVHEVLTTTLRKVTGELVESPYVALFAGLLASDVANPQAQLAARRLIPRDIANPPAAPGLTSVGGTLVMTPGGDYSLVSGAELVKKLILRRLVTQRGGFAHLPNYGTGIIAVKEPLNAAGLAQAKRDIERQALLEPEVKEVSVSLSLDNANGILTIIVKGRLKPTGESFAASFKLPSTGVL